MDCIRIYNQLIANARKKEQSLLSSKTKYYEIHHITPRSMGGDDGPHNLVALTYREHFIAHWLLFKIHKNPEMYWAWNRMSQLGEPRKYDSYRCTSIEFEIIKRKRRDIVMQMVNDNKYRYIYHKFDGKKYFLNVETNERLLVDQKDYSKYSCYPWKPLTKGRVKIVNIQTGEVTSVERGDPLLNDSAWEFMRFLYTSDTHVYVVRHKEHNYRWIFDANDQEFINTKDQWNVISTRIVNTDSYENENVYLDDPRLDDKIHWASAYERHHVFRNTITGQYKKFYLSDPRRLDECWASVNKNKVACINTVTGERSYKFETDIEEPWCASKVAVKNPDGTWPKKTCPHCKKTLVANYYYYKTHEDNCIHNPANPNYQPENPDKKLTKGKTYYINAEGEKLALTKDDPRVLSGEFWSVGKGLVTIKNIKTGQSIKVTRDDPRLKDPEWETKFKKGTFPYRNKMTGEIRLLSKDDPLRQSDQWEATNKGAHTGPRKNREYATCPYCGKVGLLQSGFTRWHMENCRHKPKC